MMGGCRAGNGSRLENRVWIGSDEGGITSIDIPRAT